MTVATERRMTLKEYLTYDDGTDTQYELEDGICLVDLFILWLRAPLVTPQTFFRNWDPECREVYPKM